MLGDGQTEYDLGNDGKANSIAACTVSASSWVFNLLKTKFCCSIGENPKNRYNDKTPNDILQGRLPPGISLLVNMIRLLD